MSSLCYIVSSRTIRVNILRFAFFVIVTYLFQIFHMFECFVRHISMNHVHDCYPQDKSMLDPLEPEWLWATTVVLGNELGPLQGQQVLLTPSQLSSPH